MADDQNQQDDPTKTLDYLNQALSGAQAKRIAQERAAQNAQQGVTDLNAAQQGARKDTQAQLGLAANQGLQQGGGGGGAENRQAAVTRANTLAGQDAGWSMQRIAQQKIADEANMEAGSAQTEYANTAEKLHQSQVANAQAAPSAAADMAKMYQDMNSGNTFYNSKQNYNDVIAKAQAQYGPAAATSPAIKAELDKFVAAMAAARDNVK